MSLAGKRVVITRAREQAEDWARALAARGATPLIVPCIAFAPPDDAAPFQRAMDALGRFDGLVVTSVNGARVVAEARRASGGIPTSVRIAAVGRASAAALGLGRGVAKGPVL